MHGRDQYAIVHDMDTQNTAVFESYMVITNTIVTMNDYNNNHSLLCHNIIMN